MIITKLIGGLGNQLFQYAIGRHLAHIHNTELKLDIMGFETYKPHSYNLKHFNIIENLATKKEIDQFKKYKRKSGKIWFLYNRLIADKSKYVQEQRFDFDHSILVMGNDTYLDGYWQTEKYFKDITDEIRAELTLVKSLSPYSKNIEEKILKTPNAVSLHVRRADLVHNPIMTAFHGYCSPEFYAAAIEHIVKDTPLPHFFIFSDDYEWVVEHFKSLPYPYTCIKNGADKNYEDLYLMSKCRHHIISNSSFGWWGAWLNPKKDKIVIAPSKWFVTTKNDTRDLLPEDWIKI